MPPLHRPLGDYYQLLQKEHLLVEGTPLHLSLSHSVSQVSCDSRVVIPHTLFICKGANFKVDFLKMAMEKGATVYVSEVIYPEIPLPCLQVTDIRRAMGLVADLAYGHPSSKLTITGLTGTKGKTTTAYYLKSIIDTWLASQNRRTSALLSTIVTDDGLERRPAKLTTPEPLDLQRHLSNAVASNCGYLTMEVSSQALKYGRVIGVELDCALFLNLGEDHISPVEHPDLEDYFQSKLLIFAQAKTACINLDANRASEVVAAAQDCGEIITFSTTDPTATIYGSDIRKVGNHIRFVARTPSYEKDFSLSTAGLFNVENALAAIAVCHAYAIPPEMVAQGLKEAFVPGRMEHYQSTDGQIVVIVDFAHNGMSLETALHSVRCEYPDREVTVLFGCTGGKAIDRREGMGIAAATLADRIILTEDDPWWEEVVHICEDIGGHISAKGKDFAIIPHREEAVRTAILGCKPPAVVLLSGKGSEVFQKRKNGPKPCLSDGTLAQRALEEYDQG